MQRFVVALTLFAILLTAMSKPQHLVAAEVAPSISKVSGKVTLNQKSSLRIEGQRFDPASVEVVIFGGRCTSGCIIPNNVLDEDGGAVTTTLLGAVPITINDAGTFQAAVRNGSQGTLSNKMDFTVQ